jgi:hypothetical protein
MGTGAEVRLYVRDVQCRTFYHNNGHPEGIGKELWAFLRNLKANDWEELEKKIYKRVLWYEQRCIYTCSNIARVNEFKLADEDVKSKYNKNFMKTSAWKEDECMRDVLYDAWRHPGYALNMVLKGTLKHMIGVSVTKENKKVRHIFKVYRDNQVGRLNAISRNLDNNNLDEDDDELDDDVESVFDDWAEYSFTRISQ